MNKTQKAAQIFKALQMFIAGLDDGKAIQITEVYPKWETAADYAVNDIVGYGMNEVGDTQLYRCLQAHTAQSSWTPDVSASLWKAIGIAPGGYPEWSQPVGASDAYDQGDIVSYKGELYISAINANVWAPDVYGWNRYDE